MSHIALVYRFAPGYPSKINIPEVTEFTYLKGALGKDVL